MAVAAMIASKMGIFIFLFIAIVLCLILFVMGFTVQYSIAVSRIFISLSLKSFTPNISISVTSDIYGFSSK